MASRLGSEHEDTSTELKPGAECSTHLPLFYEWDLWRLSSMELVLSGDPTVTAGPDDRRVRSRNFEKRKDHTLWVKFLDDQGDGCSDEGTW